MAPGMGPPFLTLGAWLVGFIELHMTLLHTKYTSFGLCGFREEEDCFMYFHYKPVEDNDVLGTWHIWTPGAQLAGFIKRNTIHCYTQNIKALGLVVWKKIFFLCFSHCKAMGVNDPRGGAILTPGR